MTSYTGSPENETRAKLRKEKQLLKIQHGTVDKVRYLPPRYQAPKKLSTWFDVLLQYVIEFALAFSMGYGLVMLLRRLL